MGENEDVNQSLEKAGRVADFLELGELMCLDALERDESCGGHFREEHQTPDGEADRDDERFSYVGGLGAPGARHQTGPAQGAARIPLRESFGSELQVMRIDSCISGGRRTGRVRAGWFATSLPDVNPHMSFLEMLDVLNEELIEKGEDPVAFDHDCREGICGTCGFVINGTAHGPQRGTTVCQLHMRHFKDGDELYLEPWRAKAFPIIKDLMVDRSAFDRIIAAGGYVSVSTGSAPDGNAIPIPKDEAELSMDAAACIGCGACVAACPNAAAALFTRRRSSHLALLPQGQPGTGSARVENGRAGERGRLRSVRQHRRMRSGVPEENHAGEHRPHVPPLHRRQLDDAADGNRRAGRMSANPRC